MHMHESFPLVPANNTSLALLSQHLIAHGVSASQYYVATLLELACY
jgi:hypothetical protein